MRWHREQYIDLLTFGEAPRPMFTELFGPLIGLDAEWRAQGATEAEISMTAFDWDYVPYVDCGGSCGGLGPPPVTLSDTAEELVQRDYLGRILRLWKETATIPLPETYPVKDMDDWRRVKPFFTFKPERINWDQVEAARRAQGEGALVIAYLPGAFDTPRELMGEEEMCLAYYEQPELMVDILATLQDTALRVLEPISEKLTIDMLMVHEDFAGKSGPLVGPIQVREYFQPYYRAVWDLLSSRGTRIFEQDTDGDIMPVLPELLDCGLTSLYPMEPAAGMDVVKVRREYGERLALRGGIDKHVLRQGRDAIRRELEYKLLDPGLRAGGCVFSLDHRIPNGTPLEDYRYYVELGRELLGLPPLDPTRTGWGRMAW
jgi:uroporphyrinogen-III decarboxylase